MTLPRDGAKGAELINPDGGGTGDWDGGDGAGDRDGRDGAGDWDGGVRRAVDPDGGGSGGDGGDGVGGDRPDGRSPGDPHGMGPARRTIREVGLALITAGVILLLFVAYQLLGTNLAEQSSQNQLKKAFQQSVAAQAETSTTNSTPPATAPGGATSSTDVPTISAPAASRAAAAVGAIDDLSIPKIGVDKVVVEGVNTDDLRRGPGHYPGTALPGQAGNAAIAGHRTTYGAPFFRLNELVPGDHIYITDTVGQRFDYVVTQSTVVSPSDVAVLGHSADARLTLTTCNPRFEATSRLVVVAALDGPVVATPPTSTTTASPPARPNPPSFGAGLVAGESATASLGTGDRNGWPPSLGYGAAFLALWVGTRLSVNRTRGWLRAGTFAGGIVVCLVPLWFCFENVVRLLPPNI